MTAAKMTKAELAKSIQRPKGKGEPIKPDLTQCPLHQAICRWDCFYYSIPAVTCRHPEREKATGVHTMPPK